MNNDPLQQQGLADPEPRFNVQAGPAGQPADPSAWPMQFGVADPDVDHQRIFKIVLAVLVVIAIGVGVWQYVPWHNSSFGAPEATPMAGNSDIEATMKQVDGDYDGIDANMAGITSALNDQQGNLGE